ncbi:oxidoreductase [Lactiplantibacillus mudanjiangensis]|uniref:Short chain dehydrogenase/reductase family oxidoreductase [Lactobacillus plantarum subsp. plantarum ST-III] n=1 Tax=Lactiplantibacillus mudanjiangensis TaxID=1296538 RepID=A0A660E365_9LACO|nr:oxidoreductase [Lactiplantibacillus mudanjiangensis]VDG26040.1 short chain dehydrogenase/reductase family oxidoreductase [Lactobacillus plantarum subsp. plantarum ST-III] [Lactiplantibacillus mudanjiangensis]VDG29122.1 short chain dehydrogenase/reductase family oxidoreductase [Lactobacillus plantarum subsp. plantarum ST-III] [Lactiplantibacillus mudanjiangensis]VDG31642.1 short chain dehydrogenase/reductase family oxidoreductase [Lactobacillus plantarum subsp. plantarum ST-III] [Lactiplantiba
MTEPRVILITGASSGIGKATALKLKAQGNIVYGAARRVEKMTDLAAAGVHVLKLDVTDEQTLVVAVATIKAEQQRLDVLINNAGYGSYGALEDVPLAEGEYQFKVNVFGVMRLTQLVLPMMRAQGAGRIINVSSIGGKIYQPLSAWYMGTKHAIEGMSDALRMELAPLGIDVIMIEPGGIKTEWAGIAEQKLLAVSGETAYGKQAKEVGAMLSLFDQFASQPGVIAKLMVRAVNDDRPKTRYHAGMGAGVSLAARKWLSDRQFDYLMNQAVHGAAKLAKVMHKKTQRASSRHYRRES